MRSDCIEALLLCNREIEFSYGGKRYSITEFEKDGKIIFSFCEFYKTPKNVMTPKDILKLKIGNKTLEDIFSELPDSAFDIY